MSQTKKIKIDWGLVLTGVDEAVEFYSSEGIKPTLRTLFYYLYSKKLLPNTDVAYKNLSRILVKNRKDGRYEWDFLEDRSRAVVGKLEDQKYLDEEVDSFKSIVSNKLYDLDVDSMIEDYYFSDYPEFFLGKWYNQEIVVEVWVEKDALSSILQKWLKDWQVPIKINRGYSSWTFIFDNVNKIKDHLINHEKVHIFYLGDLDYSGLDIQRFLNESLEYFNIDFSSVTLERLAVTEDQVELFDLPHKPGKKTLEKLEKDSRKNSYDLKYIAELDSLLAYVPGHFKKLLNDSISSKWNSDLYEEYKIKLKSDDRECENMVDSVRSETIIKLKELLENE